MKPFLVMLANCPARVVQRLFGSRERTIGTVLLTTLLLASSVWFFTARDARGRTARLTADAWYYHAYLPSMVFDRDLDFRDEYTITKNWYRLGQTPTGRQANVFGIGPAIYQIPFFLVGHAAATIAGSEAHGFSRPEVELSLYASLLFSLGAIFFASRLMRRRFGSRYGPWAVALIVACGGPVVYYAIRQPGYAHPFATFWAAWLVDHWDASFQDDTTPRGRRFWLGLGLLIGAASLARPQLVLWSVLGIYAASSDLLRARALGMDRREHMRILGRWCAGGALALVIVLPQLLAWNSLYGSVLASPQGEGFMRWGESAWLETIMSSRNGLFPWAPVYAFACIGLFVGLRRHLRICSALILGVLLQAWANGAAWDWWGGGAFGGRRFDSCFVAFAFGLGVLLLGPWSIRASAVGLRVKQSASLALVLLCALLVVANLRFASTQSAPTVRIYGGQAASTIIGRPLGVLGYPAAWASALSNLPARALFAWRNDVSLLAYDRVVGVHELGELYPGLNSFRGKKHQRLDLNPANPRVVGLELAEGGTLVSPSGRVQLLIGLNRLGPVELNLRVSSDATEAPRLRLNGHRLAVQEASPGNYTTSLGRYRRGNNRLEILSSPGLTLALVQISAKVNAAGQEVRP